MIRVLAKASNTAAVPSFARTIATAGAASARSAAADHPGAGGLVADRWTLPTAPSAGGSSGAAAVGVVLFWAMPGKGKDVVVVEHHGGRRTASEAAGGGALFQATAVNGVPFRGKVGVLGEPIPVQVKIKSSLFTATTDHPGAGGLVADRWTLPSALSAGGSRGAAAVGVVPFRAMPGSLGGRSRWTASEVPGGLLQAATFVVYRAKSTSAVAGVKDAAKTRFLDRAGAALAGERLVRLLLGPTTSPERMAVDAALKRVHKLLFGDGSVRLMPPQRPLPSSATNRFTEELRAAGVMDVNGKVNQGEALGAAVGKIVEALEQHSAYMMKYHQRAGAKDMVLHTLFFVAQILLMTYSSLSELLEDVTGHKTWESLSIQVQQKLHWVKDRILLGKALSQAAEKGLRRWGGRPPVSQRL
uniref:Uncharacterized protein n=1 Tax=Oryza meridionalis TaxID=40149 RepID=A0A0E0E7C4_9ORYZ